MILPKQLHPGFHNPAKKPFGYSFDLDRADKYGKHVIRAYVPTTNHHRCLVKGPLTEAATGPIQVVKGETDFTSQWLTYDGPIPVQTEITILARVKRNSTGATSGIFADKTDTNWDDAEGISLNLRGGTDRLLFVVESSATKANTLWGVLDNTTEFWDVAATWKAGVFSRIYVNGEEPSVGYSHQEVAASHTESTQNLMVGRYYNTSFELNGHMQYCYLLNKALDQQQIRELQSQAYRVLKPSVQMIYAPVPVAASGRIMGSLANYGGLAGQGGIAGKGGGIAG